MLKRFLLILTILFSSTVLLGNIYFWVDEDGIRHYSNTSLPQDRNVQELKESQDILKKLSSEKNKSQTFEVLKIYDGDTILVKGLGLTFKIRLVGIDSPETGYKKRPDQPFSKEAKKYLIRLLKNKKIQLESYGTGGYNRQLAEVFLGTENINIKMIQAGLAEVYRGRRPKSLDSDLYFREERKAKNARKGMWTQGSSYKSPKLWRKEHPIK